MDKKYKMLFVHAHPDDECLWTGGTIHSFNKFENIETYVLVISGRNDHRYTEFVKAMQIIAPTKYTCCAHELAKQGGIPLQNIGMHITAGVNDMGLNFNEFDIVITHPFYGDEHNHIQHKNLYYEIGEMCKEHSVPFSCFSFMPIPHIRLTPLLEDGRRENGIHLLNISECEALNSNKISRMKYDPKYYLQYKVESNPKKDALDCYISVDPKAHREGYSAWDSDVESFYIFNKKGLEPFMYMYNNMKKPSRHTLYL